VKPVVKGPAAKHDIRCAAEYYKNEADAQLAAAFIDATERAAQRISSWPGSGSARFAEALNLPGLRTVALDHFPYLIFYFERPNHLDVWRVLHTRRDIPTALDAPLASGS